jgi:putative NADH-flavin reductase
MSTAKKLIVVVGATGNQGSSVVKHFLTLTNWSVRALTRNISSPAAQNLASRGAEVVQADLSDISSLSTAFKDANAIFVNTDFWAIYRSLPATTDEEREKNGEIALQKEVEHGKNAAIAAADLPSLEIFVYSALGPMKKASKGKYSRSHHWDAKATIVDYIETEQKALAKKTSFIYLGAYATNALLQPTLDPSTGNYKMVIPFEKEFRMPIVLQNESTGHFVHALVENETPGIKLLAYNSYPTIAKVADLWSQATGKSVEIMSISPATMHDQFGIPWEVLEAALFLPEYGYMGGIAQFIEPSQLKQPVETKAYTDWLKEQDWDVILEETKKEIESVK